MKKLLFIFISLYFYSLFSQVNEERFTKSITKSLECFKCINSFKYGQIRGIYLELDSSAILQKFEITFKYKEMKLSNQEYFKLFKIIEKNLKVDYLKKEKKAYFYDNKYSISLPFSPTPPSSSF
jgi:hypothetical protein